MITLEPGAMIAGRYRLDRPLAQGGMGCVWAGHHLQLDVPVAIKLMTPQLAASPEARARFEREAKASAQLRIANTVQIYDFGIDGDVPFIVMELLTGEDLEARLAREARLSPAAALRIATPLCRALKVAHDAGVVHRDLKPANVFIASQGGEEVIKILDFGIAKVIGSQKGAAATRTGALMGSPHYMSPEQVRDTSRVDHRSDLWAVGVILFRCLTGRLPFPGDEMGEVLVDVCTMPVPIPSQIAPDLGPGFDRFFERALAREQARRFQSAAELAEAFTAVVNGVPLPVAANATAVGATALGDPFTVAASPPAAVMIPGTLSGTARSHMDLAPAAPLRPAPRRPSSGLVIACVGGALTLGAIAGTLLLLRGRAPEGEGPHTAMSSSSAAPVVTSLPLPQPSDRSGAPSPGSTAAIPPSAAAPTGEAAPPSASAVAPALSGPPSKKGPAVNGSGRRPANTKKADDLLNHM